MSDNFNNKKREIASGVDRTSKVDRTLGVDRSSGVDRTLGVDRTAGIDRTLNNNVQNRTSASGEFSSDAVRRAETYDYFPELKRNINEPTDLYSGRELANNTVEEPKEEPKEEPIDIFSGSHNYSYSDIYSNSDDEIENISSSTPYDADIVDQVEVQPEKQAKHKKQAKPLTTSQRALRITGKIALSAFFVAIIVGCIVTVAFMVYVFGFVDDSIEDIRLDELTLNLTTTIYVKDQDFVPEKDKSGNIVGEAEKWVEYQNLCYENRTWVNLNNISQNVIDAYVAAEDERFYTHSGVDFKRTFLSFVNMFVEIYDSRQGGSTITQQLIKNLTGDDEQSPIRKIREIMRARNLEIEYHKDTIIECYLNVIYLGNNAYGIEAAADYYFGKSAKDLSIAEAACITAITKAPDVYDPIKKAERNKSRREWIINNMYDIKLITKEERDAALKEKLVFAKSVGTDKDDANQNKSDAYSYFTDALFEQVIADLMETKGYSREGAENVIYRGGLKIYATMDSNIQSKVDAVFCDESNFATILNLKDTAQAAITVMDYKGNVVAIYGGRGVKTDKRGLNRATQSNRQPGSTMKPLGVYAPALEANLITWSSKIENSQLSIGGYNYHNYDRTTSDPVLVQNALARSLNIPPVRILNSYGCTKSFKFMTEKLGITTLVESETKNGKKYSDIGLSQLALGGVTYGVNTLEWTAAYAIFGNGGVYYEPTFYTKVTSNDGKETYLEVKTEGQRAISEDTAYIMNKMLNTVVTGTGGTGGAAAFGGWGPYTFAKTGTTTDNKDRWFVGGTPYYVASVWFGCDKPQAMNRLSTGSNPAMLLWKPAMKAIHENLMIKNFPTCNTVKFVNYCVETGGLATETCTEVAGGYYKSGYSETCPGHTPESSVEEVPPAGEAPASTEQAPAQTPPATTPQETPSQENQAA